MAVHNVNEILRVPGFVCINPTDLTLDFPHGGTALGTWRNPRFIARRRTYELHAEEYGSPYDAIWTGDRAGLAAILVSWDADALQAAWPDVSVANGVPIIESAVDADNKRPGILLSDHAATVCFSPEAEQSPCVVIHRALPFLDEGAEAIYRRSEEYGLAFTWLGVPDSSRRLYTCAPRAEITL